MREILTASTVAEVEKLARWRRLRPRYSADTGHGEAQTEWDCSQNSGEIPLGRCSTPYGGTIQTGAAFEKALYFVEIRCLSSVPDHLFCAFKSRADALRGKKYCCKYREKAQPSLVFEMRSIILRCPIGNNLYHALDDRRGATLRCTI